MIRNIGRYWVKIFNEVLGSGLYIERQGLVLTKSLKIHVVMNQTACYVQYKFIELLFLDGFLAMMVTQIVYPSGNSLVGGKGKNQFSLFSLSISVTPLYNLGLYVAAFGCVN